MEIENDWNDFITTSRLAEYLQTMFEIGVFRRIKNLDGYCFNNNGRCDHEGKNCIEWTKPLWFEVMHLHIKQICEFHRQSQDVSNAALVVDDNYISFSEEMFGVKAYIKSTQL